MGVATSCTSYCCSFAPECDQECVNGVCDMSVGQCACDDGYTGGNCSSGEWYCIAIYS